MGRLVGLAPEGPASGSGEWRLVVGIEEMGGEQRDSSRRDWLVEMAAIGLADQSTGDWGMGTGGSPNMAWRVLHSSCPSLVVALPLGGLMLPLASAAASCCICWMMRWVLGDGGDDMAERGVVREAVDGVGSGTLAGSTCIGDGDRGFMYGCGGAVGWVG